MCAVAMQLADRVVRPGATGAVPGGASGDFDVVSQVVGHFTLPGGAAKWRMCVQLTYGLRRCGRDVT